MIKYFIRCKCGSDLLIGRPLSSLHSRRYQNFWAVVGLERGPLSLLGTIEDLLEREISVYGLGKPRTRP
jgi:hypothetical protein